MFFGMVGRKTLYLKFPLQKIFIFIFSPHISHWNFLSLPVNIFSVSQLPSSRLSRDSLQLVFFVHSALSLISSVVGDRRISSQKSVSQQKKRKKERIKKIEFLSQFCFFSIVEQKFIYLPEAGRITLSPVFNLRQCEIYKKRKINKE